MHIRLAALASLGALLLPAALLAQQPTQSRPKPAETTEHQITEPRLKTASPPIIEFRLAESEPADGLIAANVVGTDTTVYLHQAVEATNTDIESASAGLNGSDGNPLLCVCFTKAGATKMATLTEANLGKTLALLIDGKVVVVPRLDSKITDCAQISMEDFTEAEVRRTADAIRRGSVNPPSDASERNVRSDTRSPEPRRDVSTARDERLRRLQLAAEQEPLAVGPRTWLGHHYVHEARWEEAAKWYRASLEIEPRDIEVLHNLGACYYYLGQPDQALEEFERALAVDPSHTKTLLSKGIALASSKNDVAGAKTAWERVVSLAPGTAEGDAARQGLEAMQRELQRVSPPSSRLVAEAARPADAGVIAPRVESELAPVYSTQALQAGVEGEVWVECVVLADGTVGSVAVVRSLHPDLDLNAIAAAQRWRFKPGTKKGVPVPVLVTISMSFSIRK